MPRDVSLSDSKCWNGGHEWVKLLMVFVPLDIIFRQGNHTAKNSTIRRTAVRETGDSWHHGSSIEGHPKTPRTSQYFGIEKFKGGFQLDPHYAERRGYLGLQM